MRTACWFLVTAWLSVGATPAAAQVGTWLPEPSESHLLLFEPDLPAAAPESLGSPRLRLATTEPRYVAGYLLGAALGIGLGDAAQPPKELGPWMRGWYRGTAASDRFDQRLMGIGQHGRPLAATPGAGAELPFVDGLFGGALDALAAVAPN